MLVDSDWETVLTDQRNEVQSLKREETNMKHKEVWLAAFFVAAAEHRYG